MLVDNVPTLFLQHAQWRAAKREELRRLNIDEYGNMRVTLRPLKFKHFMPMFQRAHAAAFSKERNMAGWEREGILPKFNRREYWRLKSEVSRGMAPHKRDSGSSSAKSAFGGTPLPVSQNIASYNTTDIYARAREAHMRIP
uniref:Uncharacterized protein n=1 Tax=Tetraselmis chuii TaxID=63592 RepID=A0A7S1T3T9_9CHLO|mmetsp:Transcript_42812/g.76821  ORF Transcript_42812/g.76821 Transcript_42812/m.76821 type:complete len:141 (+) Transcript_42812:540-962(+)